MARSRSVVVKRQSCDEGVACGSGGGLRVKRKDVRRMATEREARLWSCALSEEEMELARDRKLAHALRAESVQNFVATQDWNLAATSWKCSSSLPKPAACASESSIVHASCSSEVKKTERNFMKTFGRRMQAKQRVFSAQAPIRALEVMNLGQRQDLPAVYKRSTCCRNGEGDTIHELYGDEASARTAFLFDDKPLAKGRAKNS